MGSPVILLAEEDAATRTYLTAELTADGYELLIAESRRHALALLANSDPALILADVNGETLGLLDAIRTGSGFAGRLDPDTPMIVLTSHADELARVRVFEHDGDDVVTKPFSYMELRARIGAVLRRAQTTRRGAQILRAGPVVIDVRSREVRVCERPVELSGTEYRLLLALAADPQRVVTREELLRNVWGFRAMGQTRTVDSHAFRLRRKLSGAGNVKLVVNVWGVGYRLVDGELHQPQEEMAA